MVFFSCRYIGCNFKYLSKINLDNLELMSINIRITLQSSKKLVKLYYYTNAICIVNT